MDFEVENPVFEVGSSGMLEGEDIGMMVEGLDGVVGGIGSVVASEGMGVVWLPFLTAEVGVEVEEEGSVGCLAACDGVEEEGRLVGVDVASDVEGNRDCWPLSRAIRNFINGFVSPFSPTSCR